MLTLASLLKKYIFKETHLLRSILANSLTCVIVCNYYCYLSPSFCFAMAMAAHADAVAFSFIVETHIACGRNTFVSIGEEMVFN